MVLISHRKNKIIGRAGAAGAKTLLIVLPSPLRVRCQEATAITRHTGRCEHLCPCSRLTVTVIDVLTGLLCGAVQFRDNPGGSRKRWNRVLTSYANLSDDHKNIHCLLRHPNEINCHIAALFHSISCFNNTCFSQRVLHVEDMINRYR